jgi:hypothetical protein
MSEEKQGKASKASKEKSKEKKQPEDDSPLKSTDSSTKEKKSRKATSKHDSDDENEKKEVKKDKEATEEKKSKPSKDGDKKEDKKEDKTPRKDDKKEEKTPRKDDNKKDSKTPRKDKDDSEKKDTKKKGKEKAESSEEVSSSHTDSEEESEEKERRPKSKSKASTSSAPPPKKARPLRAGRVYIVASEAKGLKSKNKILHRNTADCYIQILLDDGETKEKNQKVYKSKVIKRELDPNWNESSKIFEVTENHKAVKIYLWNANKVLSDDFMGQVVFDLAYCNDGAPIDKWFELTGRKQKEKVSGKLHVQFMFLETDEKVLGEEFTSPIHTFIKKRRIEVVETLIRNADDLDTRDSEGLTPLHVATQCNLPDIVRMLIEHGADINAKGGPLDGTPLHFACSASVESAAVLIENKAKLEVADKEGNTPMHLAAKNDQPKSIVLLEEGGASLDAQNDLGNTPLHEAIKAKAFLALKMLIERGADIYVKNKEKMTCGEAAANLDEETKQIFMKAVGVEDYQEIALLQDWSHRTRVQGSGLNYEWQKSPQFAISAPKPTPVRILLHHQDVIDNSNLGYVVISGKNAVHKQPSLTELIGHGTNTPFETTLDPSFYTIVVPYAKTKDQPPNFSLLVFAKEGDEIEVKELVDWKYCQTIKGEWKGKKAGGCQNEKKTWHKNPFFSLVIPKKENVDVAIVLSQKKNAMEEIIPFQTLPYDFYIGYYLYDADVEDLIGQSDKWKNALEVMKDWRLNGVERRQYTIIPTTFKAGEETSFTLSVYSDEKKVLLKEFES